MLFRSCLAFAIMSLRKLDLIKVYKNCNIATSRIIFSSHMLQYTEFILPSSAQAQAQLEAELALFSFDTAPHPTRESLIGSQFTPSFNQTSK